MKKSLLFLVLLSLLAACGGGSRGEGAPGNPEPTASPALDPWQALLGLWVTEEADSGGFRLGLQFQMGTTGVPNELAYYLYLVDVDGSDGGGVRGSAFVDGLAMTIELDAGEPLSGPYSVTDDSLAFGGYAFKKMTGAAAPLSGTGTIKGKILLPESAAAAALNARFVPGQILVAYKSSQAALSFQNDDMIAKAAVTGVATLMERKREMSALTLGEMSLSGRIHQIVEDRQWTLNKIRELQRDPNVSFAQPNYLYKLAAVPSDTYYPLQWHYPMIGLPEAWEITKGSPDMVVGVIDSEARFDHPDLAPRLTATGYDFLADTASSNDGDGLDDDPSDPGDGTAGKPHSWHGTHVAGTIGAATNNDLGVAGVTWEGDIMPLRACGRNGCSGDAVANAILYAAGLPNAAGQVPPKKANVINMSFGGPEYDFVVASAIGSAVTEGVIPVAAAGNSNSNVIGSPSAVEGVIAVGAVGADGQKASYSSYGPVLDVVAPGGELGSDVDGNQLPDGVVSTIWNSTNGTPDYIPYEGTSMASPHVAGVVALLLAVEPSLNAAQAQQILETTATDLGSPGRDDLFGAGLINVPAALQEAAGVQSLPPALNVSPSKLQFSSSFKSRQILIQNAGGGSINGVSFSITSHSGGSWLTVSLSANMAPAILALAAEPTSLLDGLYTATIQITSSAGSKTVEAQLNVGSEGQQTAAIYVAALNPDTGEPLYVTVADPLKDFAYSFENIPVGLYRLLASTDFNGDKSFCDPQEYCGHYPSSSEVALVPVLPDAVVDGLDFSIAPAQ